MRVCLLSLVYATTAANSHESSYACYYDEKRDTYLGDWYSVNWMEDSDAVGKWLQCGKSLRGKPLMAVIIVTV